MMQAMALGPGSVDIHVRINNLFETDSSYGAELSTYTATVTSSALDYRRENGRRYHAFRDGIYLLPNDDEEADRLDMVHEMTLLMMGRRLFLAPLPPSPQRVIDVGTGTGIWAIDFADKYPSAEVFGNDLSPTQPTLVPPNVKFLIDDIEDDWGYEKVPFDFVHARYLACSIKNFKKLVQQAYNCAKPGGYVEFQDWDCMLESEDGSFSGTNIERYYKEVLGAFEKVGYCTRPGPSLEKWFHEAGFEDIHVQRYRAPLGTWPKDEHYMMVVADVCSLREQKEIGAWCLLQAEKGYEALAMAVLTRCQGWSKEEVADLIEKTMVETRNLNIHPLHNLYVSPVPQDTR
ncbi:S-adenosyl-L-methionine-dependent methyltransferase [Elaphomyces granulatus]